MQHFDMSWRAVRYRYRTSAECDEKLKAMLAAQRDWGIDDDDRNYKLDRCIYEFFTNALSVLENFGFCLYFIGNAISPPAFPTVKSLKDIWLKTTELAFRSAFLRSL